MVDALITALASSANPPPSERIAALNREFDDLTSQFFAGRVNEAMAALHAMERELAPRDPMPKTLGTGLSLRVEPRVWWTGAKEPHFMLRSFAPAQISTSGKLTIARVSQGVSTTLFERDISVEAGKVVVVEAPMPEANWPRGESVRLLATLDGVSETAEAPFSVVDGSLDALRESLLKRLDAVGVGTAPQGTTTEMQSTTANTPEPSPSEATANSTSMPRVSARTIAIARARLAALTDAPSDTNSAQALADPPALAKELSNEVAAIEGGTNPYSHRTGAYERPQGKDRTPCMIYAPRDAASDEPRPLVIALHGVGGDEAMFIRGYGGGLLCKLADDKKFIIAAPLTYKLAGNAGFIDAIINDLAEDYSIDRDRVYVIGHSLGGGMAMYLAQARADSIAAVACIAGAGPISKKVTPCPTMVVAGEIDRIGGATQIRPLVQAAITDGKPVEYREVKNYGHTLVVARALPEVVDWLFTHSLSNRPAHEPRENTPAPAPPTPKPTDQGKPAGTSKQHE